MTKRTLRKIEFEGSTYYWTRKHIHLQDYLHSACVEVLTIYQGDAKKAPIRLFFREEDSFQQRFSPEEQCWFASAGGAGILWKSGVGVGTGAEQVVNLNRPGVVAAIAKFALQNGWSPAKMTSPMEIDYGFDWIEAIDFPEPRGDK